MLTNKEKLHIAVSLASWRHRIGYVPPGPVNVNDYIRKVRADDGLCIPIVCANGSVLSVQASRSHASLPRETGGLVHYTHVEVMSDWSEAFGPYQPEGNHGIYFKVPVEVVNAVIERSGGYLQMADLLTLPLYTVQTTITRLSEHTYFLDKLKPFSEEIK